MGRIFLSFVLLFASVAARAEGGCAATLDGRMLKLESRAAGHYAIALDDPAFDEYDVMIDSLSEPGRVKVQLAKFVATPFVGQLKALVEQQAEPLKSSLLDLLKARVVIVKSGYDKAGLVVVDLFQGAHNITAMCTDKL